LISRKMDKGGGNRENLSETEVINNEDHDKTNERGQGQNDRKCWGVPGIVTKKEGKKMSR